MTDIFIAFIASDTGISEPDLLKLWQAESMFNTIEIAVQLKDIQRFLWFVYNGIHCYIFLWHLHVIQCI